MSSVSKRKLVLTLIASALVILFFTDDAPEKENIALRGLTNQEDIDVLLDESNGNVTHYKENHKPVIHTFFQPIKGQDPMLQAWKDEWESVGWQTKVLTLDDAKKHPYFDTMREAVEKVFPSDTYNQLCFYRYLAMAADGGGWMSDYDTFPTNFPLDEGHELPNEGKFTSFQAHVPSLISGTADEWGRIAKEMTEAIPNSEQWLKSDMYILKDLKDEGDHDIDFKIPSWNVHAFIGYKGKNEVDCEMMGKGRAMHISHYAEATLRKSDKYPDADVKGISDKERRAKIARVFMKDWREQCGGSNVATE